MRNLTDDSALEMTMGRIYGGLSADVADDLYGLTPGSPPPCCPRDQTKARRGVTPLMAPRLRAANDLLARAAAGQPERRDDAIGSNNWVIGPARSADGKALLANDPHLGLSNPSVWYLVSIDAGEGGLHTAGASFAGLPGVILGQNADIAWGATTTNFDMSDVYLETLSPDGEGVMFNGAAVPFVKVDQTFELSDGPDVTETFLYVPHHGPVIAIDRDAGTAVTVKWTGHDLSTDLMFPLRMNRAKSVAEARQVILDTVTSIGQNWIMIDREGDFAWFPYNHLPRRPWVSAELPSWLPLPGDGTAEWDGFLDADEIPQAHAPAAGYIATANNDMTGALADGDPTNDGLPMLQAFAAIGFRQERIQERIEAAQSHDLASMQSIQADVRALIGERTVPAILAAVDGVDLDAGAEAVRAALAGWDFTCPTGLEGVDPMGEFSTDEPQAAASAGCTAFHVLWPRLVLAAFADDRFEQRAPNDAALVRLLTRPESFHAEGDYWDDSRTDGLETAAGQITGALADASAWLTENLGAAPDAWRWGRIHTVTLAADLFSAAGLPDYDHGPFANDGGMYTVDVANPSGRFQDRYSHSSGASMRFACHAGDAMTCTIELPGGQRHFRDSPHYDDLLQKYLVNEPVAFPFTPSEVDAATVESVAVNPAP
ncbi:MAG: penicillin acylase family protein [bacterium]